jgi:hypothetical protein
MGGEEWGGWGDGGIALCLEGGEKKRLIDLLNDSMTF